MTSADVALHDPACRRCVRLASFLDTVRAKHPEYFCAPVPSFGPSPARLLVVGLAPGMHGANATGRPFTGDWCSDLLYGTLHAFGFASATRSLSRDDALKLIDCRLTNAVRCLPPANKPTPAEVRTCGDFLRREIEHTRPRVIVVLGRVAHDAVLTTLGASFAHVRRADWVFGHAAVHRIPGAPIMIDSYHPSRYNTQTGRLTPAMLADVFRLARDHAV